ncbi:MAG TPA: neutral/alkaline non-lysosomal ceramidase N-terminal domain-containing protein [bacterium]|nr:neutral/alkaline non-lysosomal ceramidase N-terminal domain-containing protein [bacterium]
MKILRRALIVLASGLIILFSAAAADESVFSAGAAVADITPDLSARRVPLAGYSARLLRPARGVHDPIHCKAITVSDGARSVALVSCDLVSVSAALREKVIADLAGTNYGDDNLLLCATHSHSGPAGYDKNALFQALFGRYNDAFTTELAHKIAAAVKAADAAREPAAMRIAAAELPGLVRNRRFGKDYSYTTRHSKSAAPAAGPTNPVLTVVRFDGADGAPIAVLFHFAAHATIMGADNMLITAEWPGVAMDRIEAAASGAVAMFMNGAEGDQTPIVLDDGADDWTWRQRIGSQMGDAVIAALDTAFPAPAAPVSYALMRESVPGPGHIMGLPLSARATHALFPALTLQAVRIGDLALLAVPVEMTATPGKQLRDSALRPGITHPLVVGLANDFYWYCAEPDEFSEGSSYEPGTTIFGKKEAGIVIEEQMKLMDQVMGRQQ